MPTATDSGWTVATLKQYTDMRERAEDRFQNERDKRYAEVAQEREKALKIKETADLAALELAREIQTYKDEKASETGDQFASERSTFATKNDLAEVVTRIESLVKPLSDYIVGQQGRHATIDRRDDRLQPVQLWMAGAGLVVLLAVVNVISQHL